MNEFILRVFAAYFGAIVGSFLNVLIYRLPRGMDFVFTRSSCPNCQYKIPWYYNLPIISYLLLQGKCRNCAERISLRYPLVETLMAISALIFLPSFSRPGQLVFFIYYLAIFSAFVVHFFIDLEHHLLLDRINIYLLILIFPYVVFFHSWKYWLFGALLGFGGTYIVTWAFYAIRGKIGLGGGDIKLFGILGLWLGPLGIVQNIFLSCFLGSIVGLLLLLGKKMDRDHPIPFGPFILVAATFQVFFPQAFRIFSKMIGLA